MKIEPIGDVGVWWVDRPNGPRVPPRIALGAAMVTIPPLIVISTWVHLRGEDLWPWTTVMPVTPSLPQYLLRYALLLVAGLAYVLATSVPAWVRLRRTAAEDLRGAADAAKAGRWEEAALRVHRHALLLHELGRSLSGEAEELNRAARPHLAPRRRLYIYHGRTAPPVPEAPTAGFHPRVVPLSVGGGWWSGMIVAVVGVGALAEFRDACVTGKWHALGNLSFILSAIVLLSYAYVYVSGFLGRRDYFRFAPGWAELMRFKIRSSRTQTEIIRLRDCDVSLDVTRSTARLAFADRPSGRSITEYYLRRNTQNVATCLRAVLSTATVQPLPGHELTA